MNQAPLYCTPNTLPPDFMAHTALHSILAGLLEEPFGREKAEVNGMIDFVVAIDVPLEIALARRLLQIAERPGSFNHPEEVEKTMHSYV